MNLEELSSICMQMISSAGEGRFLVHEGLRKYLGQDFAGAETDLLNAEAHLGEAHRIQFEELMVPQINGTELPASMLLSHAMDLLMVSTSEYDLLKMVIGNQQEKNQKAI